ncbi:docking protein 1 [Pseudophryne corroboree]|uniref:docking protein 1 n=1 Tax=Pseudophryne corroboree TaxID=495146 RepID=UPI003081B613
MKSRRRGRETELYDHSLDYIGMSAPDKPLKEGQLHVKQNKFGKKWKRCYVLLYPDSPFGVARLEFYDWKDGTLAGEKIYTRRAADRKVVRLAECIHVAPAPTENGHKENMAAFIIGTSDKTMLLSAERALCDEWVQRLSELAFQGKVNECKSSQEKAADTGDSASLEMAVNSIYFSREEVSEFLVTVQRTEAAERCSLRGPYILRAEADCLILKEPNTKDPLYSWPYKLLRRYGRDKVMFSFEAGRRCSSGPGNFTFETSQGHEIFQKVESSIRAQQGPEKRLSFLTLDTECPTDNTSLGSDPGGSEVQAISGIIRKDADGKALKSRVLPNLPLVKPSQPQHLLDTPSLASMPGKSNTPPRSPVGRSLSHHCVDNEQLGVYSEPKDSVKGVKSHFDPLYSDPVDSVARKEIRSNKDMSLASPLYSDLYEKVDYEVVGGSVSSKALSLSASPLGCEEHIYDEPEGIALTETCPPLYSEVHLKAAAWKKEASDEKLGYEYPYNPKTDDYSVPNFQGTRSQPRSRAGPKPVPAPKPQGKLLSKPPGNDGDSGKIPVHTHITQSNSNNNNNGNIEAVYSQVQKPNIKEAKLKSAPALPLPAKPQFVPPLPLTARPPSEPTLCLPMSITPHPSLLPAKPQTEQVRSTPETLPCIDRETGVPSRSGNKAEQSLQGLLDDNNLSLIYEDLGIL